MNELLNKKYFIIQILYWSTLLTGIVLFVVVSSLNVHSILHGGTPNAVLERYGIILTLAGIPGALKVYHYFTQKMSKQSEEKRATLPLLIYILRLSILEIVVIFNVVGLYLTGSKNFFFLIFITLVAFLFCLPNKKEFVTLCEGEDTPS